MTTPLLRDLNYARFVLAFLAAIGCAQLVCTRSARGVEYHVTELGFSVLPRDVNDQGQVVGTLRRDPDSSNVDHPFYWQPGATNAVEGTLSELPMLSSGNGDGQANSINNVGQIVGASDSSSDDRAVLWQPTPSGPSTHSLHILGNPTQTTSDHYGMGINESGQIVGSRFVQFGASLRPTSSFLWMPDIPNGVTGSRETIPLQGARDLNDKLVVAGLNYESGMFPDTINHAVVWSAATDTVADIGEPPGNWDDIFGTAINNSGQIVGYADGNLTEAAFLWSPSTPNGTTGVMQSLPGMGYALDINDAGTVVGYTNGAERAAIWTQATGTVLLEELVAMPDDYAFHRAVAINNKGQVLVWGSKSFRSMGLLLTPVPEPTTALLFMLGSLLIVFTRKSPQ